MKFKIRKRQRKINETKKLLFQKLNKIDKPSSKTDENKEKRQYANSRNESEDITTNLAAIETI